MPMTKEERVYVEMRRNTSKQVRLDFKHYEIRTRAQIFTDSQQFEYILPTIQLSRIIRYYIREEVLFELRKIKGAKEADLAIEIFAVYGTFKYRGEYKRYLGELQFFMSGIDKIDDATYQIKKAVSYIKKPDYTGSIPERI